MTDFADVVAAVRKAKNVSTAFLTDELGLSYKTASEYIQRMERENIITPPQSNGERKFIRPAKREYTATDYLSAG